MELEKFLDMRFKLRYNEFINSEEWFFTLSLKETDNMTAKNLESICSLIKDM